MKYGTAATHAAVSAIFVSLIAGGAAGQTWRRAADWTAHAAGDAGRTNGHPDTDSLSSIVWQYESVPLGMGLGEPTSKGQAPADWHTGAPAKLTWDASGQGGAGSWTGGDDVGPLINSNSLTQFLNHPRVPVVRWLNPTRSAVTVALSGTLTVHWSRPALNQPIDFILMRQQPGGAATPLALAIRKPSTFPKGKYNDTDSPNILIDLPAVQVPAGGSIFYTLRYEDATNQTGSVVLDDSNLTITLKALAGVPLTADDAAVTDQNEMVNVEVLANDQWAPQALPRVSVVTGPTHGTAVVKADQSVDYTPAADFTGTDTLTYQLNDGVSVNTARLTVTVHQPYYLHVSPNGNDAHHGTSWADALATVEGARDKIRSLRAGGSLNGKVVEIVLDDGVYVTDHTIQFDATDSGSTQYPVTYRARHPLLAAISGGKTLKLAWQPYAALPGAYVADLSATGLTPSQLNNLHTLIVNGSRAVRARLPRTGYYTIVSADPNTNHTANLMNTFTFGDTDGDGRLDIQSAWTNLTNVEVVSYAQWTESRMRIASVDDANRQVQIRGSISGEGYLFDYGAIRDNSGHLTGATDGTCRYYIENVLEGLDQPGEWYLDPAARKIYYHLRTGETVATASFVVPILNQLIQINGTTSIRFDGLVFRDTDWTMPVAGQPGSLAGVWVPTPAAIVVDSATNIAFANSRVTNTGFYGIQLKRNATRTVIVNTEFVGNGGGGVVMNDTNPDVDWKQPAPLGNHRIALNRIHDNNAVWREADGIFVGARNGCNRIAGNTIANTTYSGIHVGWFDFNPLSVGGHNQIVWNQVANFSTVLYDSGGIYALGGQPGTVIMGNAIHGGLWTANHRHRKGGPINGIYIDETSSGEVIKGNIIYDANNGIFLHDVRDLIIVSNILADTQPITWGTLYIGNAQGALHDCPVWLESNVIAWTRPPLGPVRLMDGYSWTKPWYALDRDVIAYGPATIEKPQQYGLPYLQSVGHDQRALVTTHSLFVSPAAKDYRIRLAAQPLVRQQGFSADWLLESPVSANHPPTTN